MTTKWPKGAPYWSEAQIEEHIATSSGLFRDRRLQEPLNTYLEAFDELQKANYYVIRNLKGLFGKPVNPVLLASMMVNKWRLMALRYLVSPPISEDDLRTLIGANLAWKEIERSAKRARAIRDVIRQGLDPHRFPWIGKKVEPTKEEVRAAILASCALAAAQCAQTSRRNLDGFTLEGEVRNVFQAAGMKPIHLPRMGVTDQDQIRPGEYSRGSCQLQGDKADIVARLFDKRLLAIECKSSNSAVNSIKRINKEVVKKCNHWSGAFGQVLISAGVIQGVFGQSAIIAAQDERVVLFWGHDLDTLRKFVVGTKPSRRKK